MNLPSGFKAIDPLLGPDCSSKVMLVGIDGVASTLSISEVSSLIVKEAESASIVKGDEPPPPPHAASSSNDDEEITNFLKMFIRLYFNKKKGGKIPSF